MVETVLVTTTVREHNSPLLSAVVVVAARCRPLTVEPDVRDASDAIVHGTHDEHPHQLIGVDAAKRRLMRCFSLALRGIPRAPSLDGPCLGCHHITCSPARSIWTWAHSQKAALGRSQSGLAICRSPARLKQAWN